MGRAERGVCVLGLGLLLVGLVSATEPAQAEGMQVEPGKWEFQSSSQVPMLEQPRIESYVECVNESELLPDTFMQEQSKCTVTNVEASAARMAWIIDCPSDEGLVKGTAEMTSTGKAVAGHMNLAMEMQGQRFEFAKTWQGKWIGPCE